jgi:hypothetical protein
MTIQEMAYRSVADLLAKEATAVEDAATAKIIKRLKHVRVDRELSRGEFLDICYWKSPRGIRRCEKNLATRVEQITQKVFATRSEKEKIDLLTGLEGVSIPTASAILTLTRPGELWRDRYQGVASPSRIARCDLKPRGAEVHFRPLVPISPDFAPSFTPEQRADTTDRAYSLCVSPRPPIGNALWSRVRKKGALLFIIYVHA